MPDRDAFCLAGSPSSISTAGLVAVGADLAVIHFVHPEFGIYAGYSIRGVIACAVLLFLIFRRKAMPSDFGMSIVGWRGDVKLVFKMGLVVLGIWILLFAAVVVSIRLGWIAMSDYMKIREFSSTKELWDFVLNALICAPIVEELVYRGFAVPALASGFGRRWAVWLSGPVFYLLHLSYGYHPLMLHYNVAGWILAWAFVRTGRIWVPILLHSLGNLLLGFDDALHLYAPGLSKTIFGQ